MPFRLGLPHRLFHVAFFDKSLLDEMPAELCTVWYVWYGDSPEEIYERAESFSQCDANLSLVKITEVLWECNLND